MKKRLQILALRQLAQLDVDAIRLYDSAIAHATVPSVREALSSFRVDHVRHVQDLNRHIERLGGVPVDMAPDLKGLVLQGFTSATSRLGTRAALVAMVANEQLTTATYTLARRIPWESDALRALVESHQADEKRHLGWILRAVPRPESVPSMSPSVGMGAQEQGA